MELDWHALGSFGIYSAGAVLCLIGFALSCLSLSGTWLVLIAAGLMAWIRWPGFPGLGTLACFLLVCIGVEVIEAVAGAWGVQRRGGSRAAGCAALAGGFLGMLAGGLIPIPVIGSLIGMIAGSFIFAFIVEHARMKKTAHAAHVATGAVISRLAVIFLKIGLTLAMSLVLAIGVAVS